jgi:hypothetical protein
MKTFLEYLNEANRIFPDVAPKKQFGDDTKMKLLSKGVIPPQENPNKPVDTTGANSPFADPEVKSYKVTADKPMIGKDDAVKRALAAKGYDETGNKTRATSYPNVRPAKSGMATDTKFKLANITQKINTPSAKQSEPVVKPKVGSLVTPQSGYPAAKKTQLAPAENQKASSGGSYKIKPGDNPTEIANALGLTLDQLEDRNPGILKRAKRLKIGDTINR